jgi:hypothetical protein
MSYEKDAAAVSIVSPIVCAGLSAEPSSRNRRKWARPAVAAGCEADAPGLQTDAHFQHKSESLNGTWNWVLEQHYENWNSVCFMATLRSIRGGTLCGFLKELLRVESVSVESLTKSSA